MLLDLGGHSFWPCASLNAEKRVCDSGDHSGNCLGIMVIIILTVKMIILMILILVMVVIVNRNCSNSR